MTLAVIVQARVSSTRLPGKVLMDLGGATALARCLQRCARIPGADLVVAAVPDCPEDDPVAQEAARLGFPVVRGPRDDVLARYALAARGVKADSVMRVTSDCPLIDPAICGRTIALWRDSGADYGCNNMPPRFPHGLDCEVFSARILHQANETARHPYEREHVTPWIRTNGQFQKSSVIGPGCGFEMFRWTLDYPEDLAFFRALYAAYGPGAENATGAEYAALCLRRPDLLKINDNRIDPSRLLVLAEARWKSEPIGLNWAA